VLSSVANGGNAISAIASAVEAGLNTENYQRRQRAIQRAEELADLQLKQQQNALRDQELSVQEKESTLENKINKSKYEALSAEEKYKSNKFTNDQNKENKEVINATIRYQSEAQKAQADLAKIKRNDAYLHEALTRADNYNKKLREQFGVDSFNIEGQNIYDNSPYIKSLPEMFSLMDAYRDSDEYGDYIATQMGFQRVEENGKDYLVSFDGKDKIEATYGGIKMFVEKIQKRAKEDIYAATVAGSDSANLQEYVTKGIVTDPESVVLFGSVGNTFRFYQDFLRSTVDTKKGAVPRFSKEELYGHIVSRSLKTALIDGKITEEEKGRLAPQLATMIKKLGGEIRWGDSAETSGVKRGDGSFVPLIQLSSDLEKRDVVMQEYRQAINNIKSSYKDKNGFSLSQRIDFDELSAEYGYDFLSLSDKEQLSLMNVLNGNKHNIAIELRQSNVDSVDKLPTETLKSLDKKWSAMVEDAELEERKFISPFYNVILERQIKEDEEKLGKLKDVSPKYNRRFLPSVGETDIFRNYEYRTNQNEKEKKILESRIRSNKAKLERRGITVK
jgi:hypothetical protein